MSETVVVTVKPGSRKGPLVTVGDDGALTVYGLFMIEGVVGV